MSTYCRRTIEFGIDAPGGVVPSTVDSADAALAVITTAMNHPPRPQVIVLVLDADLRGHAVVIVDGTDSPDAVIDVLEVLAEGAAEASHPASLVVAAVRPGYDALPGDGDRWLELCEIAETHGCELLEWFVLSDDVGMVSPRPARRATALAMSGAQRRFVGSTVAGAPLGGAEPQSGGAQPPHEVPAVDLLGAGSQQARSMLLRYVVVVALESATRYTGLGGKGVKLLERLVRHQMAPPPAAPPPPRLVDQHGHSPSASRTGRSAAAGPFACLVAPRPPPGDTGLR